MIKQTYKWFRPSAPKIFITWNSILPWRIPIYIKSNHTETWPPVHNLWISTVFLSITCRQRFYKWLSIKLVVPQPFIPSKNMTYPNLRMIFFWTIINSIFDIFRHTFQQTIAFFNKKVINFAVVDRMLIKSALHW